MEEQDVRPWILGRSVPRDANQVLVTVDESLGVTGELSTDLLVQLTRISEE